MEKILILDIETTGFQNQGGKIVEVGIVELDLSNGERKIIFDEVTHEDGITLGEVQNAWIIQNSDLTMEAIRHSKNLKHYKQEIQTILDSYPHGATAFNNDFDFNFLKSRGFIFPNELDCPMKLSTDILKLPSRHPSHGKYKFPKVQEAYDHFFGKTEYIELHRGADDAYHEAEIVYELFKRNVFKLNEN